MHKIKKGIKKKIKGKKGKHDDDEIFTEEELEQYKRAEEAKRLAQEQTENPLEEEHFGEEQPTHSDTRESSPPPPESKDWKSFLATTDVVLKETTDNLEHIKESSYYQHTHISERAEERKADFGLAGPSSQRPSAAPSPVCGAAASNWVDLEKEGFDDEELNSPNQYQKEEPFQAPSPPPKKFVELKPIEDFPEVSAEDYADVFDTAFVDDVEKGDLKLIIPDSPVDEYSNEPDPFDTSVADKVLHTEPEKDTETQVIKGTRSKAEVPKKRKIQLVSLGNAVDVLTGKSSVETKQPNEESEVSLLGDENEADVVKYSKALETEENSVENNIEKQTSDENIKDSELNDILFGIDEPVDDLPDIVIPVKTSDDTSKLEEKDNDFDIQEFLPQIEDNQSESNALNLNELAAEFEIKPTLLEETELKVRKSEDDPILDEFDAEFASLAHESIAKTKEKEIDELGLEQEDDPFDTSYLGESVQENLDTESKVAPDDILDSTHNDITDVDPFDTSIATKVIPIDHLQSTEHDKDLADTLIPGCTEDTSSHAEDFDPFDTSAADAFGQTELKVLESELLSKQNVEENDDSDFDFNPREEEEHQQNSHSCAIGDNFVEGKVLNYLTSQAAEDFDPFDTSITDQIQLDSIAVSTQATDTLSKNNTEHGQSLSAKPKRPPRPVSPASLLVVSPTSEDFNPTLVPTSQEVEINLEEEVDPFDTSIANAYGKTELKALEAELLTKTESNIQLAEEENQVIEVPTKLGVKIPPPRPESPACLLAATPVDENPSLTPQAQTDQGISNEDDLDPFDTSIAQQFGKTELQVLEFELLDQRPSSQLSNCDDFDPRAVTPTTTAAEVAEDNTLLDNETDIKVTPIQPIQQIHSAEEDVDPFDTSIASKHVKLGSTEVKYLENEFLEQQLNSNTEQSNSEDCLLATTPIDSGATLPLQPVSAAEKNPTVVEDIDPFDTSIADQFGKTEIKELEEELLASTNSSIKPKYPENLKGIDLSSDKDPFDTSLVNEVLTAKSTCLSDEDFDFNPRGEDEQRKQVQQQISLLDSTEDSEVDQSSIKLLQPRLATNTSPSEEIESDPFDTSIAANIAPGKTEIKLLESELL